jgi:hypothetical protein
MGKDPKTEPPTLRLKNGNAVHLAARGTVTATSCAVPVVGVRCETTTKITHILARLPYG